MAAAAQPAEQPWKRHTIDASSRGADGVRLADANGDGRPDIVTGWEQGGRVRLYLNPGPMAAKAPWPAVTVGDAGAVEDAVLVDLDGDGALDVVSCSEGDTRCLSVHWAPREKARLLDPAAWKTEILTPSRGMMQWMYCLPVQVDGRNGVDLFAGGKNRDAALGWWEAPANPRDLSAWRWHRLRAAGWIMSLVGADMDGDCDQDILFTDRKGAAPGCFWLEHPGRGGAVAEPWREHSVGGQGREVMLLARGDLDGDSLEDVIVPAKPQELLFLRRLSPEGRAWDPRSIACPPNSGGAKAVNAADIDGDHLPDLVFSCEGASDGKWGVTALLQRRQGAQLTWQPRMVGGPDGVKHDLVELLDLDGDGDRDVLTCEESKNLGVFWYENPLR